MTADREHVLVVGPAWVGDMVMAQTLFKLLKQTRGDVLVDVLAPDWTRPLLERMPEVNQALSSPFGHGQLHLAQRYRLGQSLREQHYDQAIVLPGSFKSALVPFFARIPKRTGWRGEMRWGVLNDMRQLDKEKWPLMIERFMALGLEPDADLPTESPLPKLELDPQSVEKTLSELRLGSRENVSKQPILALCPGAEYGPAKRWPPEYFAELAKAKTAENWSVFLFGGPKDQEMAAQIQQGCGNACLDLTGKTSLSQAIDLLSLASAVVSNDSGLMHVAAALDRPMVVIYGSSSPKFTPPLTDNVQVLSLNLECSPCFKRACPLGHFKCMRDLKPKQVLEALNQ